MKQVNKKEKYDLKLEKNKEAKSKENDDFYETVTKLQRSPQALST